MRIACSQRRRTWRARCASARGTTTAPCRWRQSDAFALFLKAFVDAMRRRDFGPFERALLDDAALLARLRHAAGVTARRSRLG